LNKTKKRNINKAKIDEVNASRKAASESPEMGPRSCYRHGADPPRNEPGRAGIDTDSAAILRLIRLFFNDRQPGPGGLPEDMRTT
jgi:hypothetical protein